MMQFAQELAVYAANAVLAFGVIAVAIVISCGISVLLLKGPWATSDEVIAL